MELRCSSLKRVLVADDNQTILRLWARVLEREEFEVITASNGQEAIQKISLNQFSVIFTDLSMPTLGGMELLKYCQDHNIQSCVNILTGVGTIQGAVECMKLGACNYLTKPFEYSELIAAANRCLNHFEQRQQIKSLKDVIHRMEELDRMKTELISNVSHELRTPLFSLGAAVDLFLDEMGENLNEKTKNLGEIIRGNFERLSKIVSNILNLARLDKGALKPTIGVVDIVDLLKKNSESFSLLAAKKGICLIVDLGGENHKNEVEADSDQINQVITNLLGNSLKFTPDGGQIGLGLKDCGHEFELEVWDTGKGIPREFLSRIFDRFYQVNGSLTREVGGLGIGLAISKGIVENHGGKIWMESENGKGSRCHVRIPKHQPDKEEIKSGQ